MKIISVFNNKGGVGKTTLTFHVAHALAEMGHKVLVMDADPQCNLTIYALDQEYIHDIWEKEDSFIDEGYESSKKKLSPESFEQMVSSPRSIHYLLKPTEEGTGEHISWPPPIHLTDKLDMIPGRLTLHLYEEKVASRWTDVYRGEPLAIRTITRIRGLAEKYSDIYGYDYVLIDTSPSLGALNKVIISTVDGFFIPALPDLFSLYGIKNIGKALSSWKEEFDIIYRLISDEKRGAFPKSFVTFLGYTIYNAKKYSGTNNKWNLAHAHLKYAEKIPSTIEENIKESMRDHLTSDMLSSPIGGTSVMHTHNTFPSMAQHYNTPMWMVPAQELDFEHENTVRGASGKYTATKDAYMVFSADLVARVALLGDDNG